ncbi:hypothetical protein DPMN_033402 [Dreissena polymorpha]|uniref:Uncharacterized protein n=1 Tax=Dreissena polymorpha TaxID=45954 RepID=A0A9D4M5L1_DREPO|nr:hypothetical protein DPMN_033402 [Dreissena polymorpha]
MLKLAQTNQPTDQPTDQQTNRRGKNNMSPTTIATIKDVKKALQHFHGGGGGRLSSDNHLVDGPTDRQTHFTISGLSVLDLSSDNHLVDGRTDRQTDRPTDRPT